jgi:hypothetical protein
VSCHAVRAEEGGWGCTWLQVAPNGETLAAALAAVDAWAAVAEHPNVVALRDAFVSSEVPTRALVRALTAWGTVPASAAAIERVRPAVQCGILQGWLCHKTSDPPARVAARKPLGLPN